MKIHFSKKEYRQLLELVFLGDWIVTAHQEGKPVSPYDAIKNKIYSHAKDHGYENLVEYDKNTDEYFETMTLTDSNLMRWIDLYNRHFEEQGGSS